LKAEPESEVEGASRRQARSVGRKVDRRRKLEVGTKAEPGIGQRRKSQDGSKAGLEGWWKARAGSQSEGTARRSTEAQAESWHEGEAKDAAADESRRLGSKARAGGPIEGASWRSEGKRSRKTDRGRELEVSWKAGWRLAGGASRRLVERPVPEGDRRRESKIRQKVEQDGRSKAQAGDRVAANRRIQQPMRVGG